MRKKLTLCVSIALASGLLAGCVGLKPSEITINYVQNAFEADLASHYGVAFVVDIASFNEKTESREATAVAYPKNDPSLSFSITGYRGHDPEFGSASYYIKDDFEQVLFKKIETDLTSGQSFEIGKGADYELVASNIRSYIEKFRNSLVEYKQGSSFDIYFESNWERAIIPLTLNGKDISEMIILDKGDGKVINYPGGIKLEEYLQLLATGQLEAGMGL
jgi:hypothetical protein